MRFGVKAASASTIEKVSSDLITARKVIFTPSMDIKNELRTTSVSIACYDRNGQLIKTINSAGDKMGDFEVELLASPENSGTFEGAGFYNENEMVVVKAIPASGYQFVKWSTDDYKKVESDINLIALYETESKSDSSNNGNSGGSNSGGSNNSGSSGSRRSKPSAFTG